MAAVDFFLKFDGIKGESTDAKHKDEVVVESWSWGETLASSGAVGRGSGAGAAGKVAMQDFHFVMRLNRATPALMRACATGQHIKSATLVARKAGKDQHEYLTFKLSDVLISSYQTGGAGGQEAQPHDQVSLNFAKIEVAYRPQKPDGSLGAAEQFGFDVKANKAF